MDSVKAPPGPESCLGQGVLPSCNGIRALGAGHRAGTDPFDRTMETETVETFFDKMKAAEDILSSF